MSDSRTQTSANPAPLLLLHPDDNVLVCVSPIAEGQLLPIDGNWIPSPQSVGVGHKLARRPLVMGDKVYRYGAPIGSVTQAVAQGEHLHMHNMQSNYIPSHTRQQGAPHR